MRASYESELDWQKYQTFFLERYRCPTPNATPFEEWWRWRAFEVHLDRIDVTDARLKVIVLHGLGGYGRFLTPLCYLVRNLGCSAVAPDLPGYGISHPKSGIKYGDWIQLCCDLVEVEFARDQKPVVLFGLSLGGFLAYQVAAHSKRVEAVMATTLVDVRRPELTQPVMKSGLLGSIGLPLLRVLSPLADRLPIPIGQMIKMEMISNDEKLNDVIGKDSLGGASWVTAGFLKSISEAPVEIEPEDFKLPLLLAHPGHDRMTPFSLSEPFFRRLGGPKKLVMLENCGHVPIEKPGVYQLEEAVANFLNELASSQ